jgi:hypothetical protein
MLNDHVGEDAELFALGQLDDVANARLTKHVRTCEPCARRVGEAEDAVLRLIEAGDVPAEHPLELDKRMRFERSRATSWWPAAVVAALLIGLLPWGVARMQRSVPVVAEQQAAGAMLAGHFNHAALRALRPDVPSAKVIYPRAGGWLYLLVAPGKTALDLAVVAGGARRTLASLPSDGRTRTAFVRYPGRVNEVELLENGAPVASARLVY